MNKYFKNKISHGKKKPAGVAKTVENEWSIKKKSPLFPVAVECSMSKCVFIL